MKVVLLAVVVLILDQLSKYVVRVNMELYQSIPVIENIFHITYIRNPGAAFGILAQQTLFFIIITSAVLIGMAVFYRHIINEGPLVQWSMGMVAGGAVGNLIDRVRYGEVVDFFDFRIWPVFNIADIAIVLGVGLLIIEIFRRPETTEDKGEQ